jgi:hypothetical protein
MEQDNIKVDPELSGVFVNYLEINNKFECPVCSRLLKNERKEIHIALCSKRKMIREQKALKKIEEHKKQKAEALARGYTCKGCKKHFTTHVGLAGHVKHCVKAIGKRRVQKNRLIYTKARRNFIDNEKNRKEWWAKCVETINTRKAIVGDGIQGNKVADKEAENITLFIAEGDLDVR